MVQEVKIFHFLMLTIKLTLKKCSFKQSITYLIIYLVENVDKYQILNRSKKCYFKLLSTVKLCDFSLPYQYWILF